MPTRKKIVLITGGAGFLGSHLCDRFLAEGYKVVAVDNFITGSRDNVRHLSRNPDFDLIKQDVCEPFAVTGPLHYVLHLASPASPVDYLDHPVETLKVGSYGTFNTLELARTKKAVYLVASTSEVYGDPHEHPQKETYWGNVNSVGVRSVYDEAKRFAEAMTMAYRRKYKMATKIIRIFNTYGPRMAVNDGRVVPNFIDQALRGQPLTVYGEGVQTRSFCFYSDLIDGIYRMALSGDGFCGPVNLGNPDEFTIMEFARLVLAMTGHRSEIIYNPLPSDDPQQRRPDISLARKELGWEPQVKLQDGLKTTLEWFAQKSRTAGRRATG